MWLANSAGDRARLEAALTNDTEFEHKFKALYIAGELVSVQVADFVTVINK